MRERKGWIYLKGDMGESWKSRESESNNQDIVCEEKSILKIYRENSTF